MALRRRISTAPLGARVILSPYHGENGDTVSSHGGDGADSIATMALRPSSKVPGHLKAWRKV
jgi:hypothetical protein